MRYAILVMTLSMPLAAHAAGIYRWIDDQGNVHFGDAPPRPHQAKQMAVPPVSGPVPAARGSSPLNQGAGLRPGELERLRRVKQRDRKEAAERAAAVAKRSNKYQKERAQAELDKKLTSVAREGKVLPGMNADQVREAWGNPQSIHSTDDSGGHWEHWWYGWNSVHFKNGRVFSVSHDVQNR